MSDPTRPEEAKEPLGTTQVPSPGDAAIVGTPESFEASPPSELPAQPGTPLTLVSAEPPEAPPDDPISPPRLTGPKGPRKPTPTPSVLDPGRRVTPEQRLLILDTWQRSGLPAVEFARLVGVSKHTLYTWKDKFEEHGPAGLMDAPSGRRSGSRLPELTKRAILMMRKDHGDWGCQRISDMLVRGPGLYASPQAVARVLTEAGIELEATGVPSHETPPRRFERAKANQLWQTDLFTFTLKRHNRRVYLIGFMDDHSRFMVSYGVYGSCTTEFVIEVLRAGIASYGPPEEVLTDNGPQYVTWRGKSAFTKECERLGLRQIVSKPKHPETLGKIERFWGSLWKECLQGWQFVEIEEARSRIGHYIDHHNFKRPHQGLDGLVPADRFFGASEEVKKTLSARVAENALSIARHGVPKEPFYVTGQVGGKAFSVHAEGERVILTSHDGERKEIDVTAPTEETPPEMPKPVCPQGAQPSERPPQEEGQA